MRSETDPKKRLVVAAIDLMRMYGLKAASVREVAKHAKAPLGSTYHYFPNGKQEIINEALNLTGNLVLEKLDQQQIREHADGILFQASRQGRRGRQGPQGSHADDLENHRRREVPEHASRR